MPSSQFVEEARTSLVREGLSFTEAESIAADLSTAKTRADLQRWASDRQGELTEKGMSFSEAAGRVATELSAVGLWGAYSGDASAAFTGSERTTRGATLPQPRTPEQADRDTERVYAAARDLQKQKPGMAFHEAIDAVIRDHPEYYGMA